MVIHFIRHGDAESSKGKHDSQRSLSALGQQQAKSLAAYLKDKEINAEIWCSDAIRTRETLDILRPSFSTELLTYDPELYLCPKETYLHKLWSSTPNEDLIIVGHNFGISDICSYFSGESHMLNTAEYLAIEFPGLSRQEVSQETGIIIDRFCP